MDEAASGTLDEAARLRDQAKRALQLAPGLTWADQLRLIQYAEQMTERAVTLERQAGVLPPLAT